MDLSFLAGVFASPLNIIRSVIDIGIVAYVFYRILGLIKDTRAAQLNIACIITARSSR